MRLLTLDIETAPNLAYVWGLWDQNVGLNQIAEVSTVICFAAKWHGDKRIHYHSDHHDGHQEMVKAAWDLLDEAEGLITYNGKAFDVKHLYREFIMAGLPPPSPHKDIDLLSTARGRFKFASNKLEHVASQLGIGHKVQHSGFDLWLACMRGDDKAWDTMRRYNKHDVVLTEQLYDRLLPYIKNHPNVTLTKKHSTIDDPEGVLDACPQCGRPGLQKRGLEYTAVSVYQRWYCRPPTGCGKWSRSTHRENSTSRVGVA